MKLAILAMAGTLALSQPALGERPHVPSAKQIRAIRTLVTGFMTEQRAPGATFAIGLSGRIAWTEGFGYADVENRVRATPETAYRTASIGKSMTATAAMELVEQGKLDLDAPIQKYCPRFPAKPWPITSRDLISHTSGIRAPNETSELYNTRHFDHVSEALGLFDADPLTMQPGADFQYTTWGYVTLGCVLEGATGEEYRALMKRMIFDPAGMASTRDDDPRAIIPHRARGYIIENGVMKNSGWTDMSAKMAAGGWVTTASDLVRFMTAWMDGKFVSPKTQALMLRPYVLPRHGGTVDGFGMGWFLDDYHGTRAGFHGGGTPQVSGIAFFVPKKHLAIAAIFNLQDIDGGKRIALAEAIADIVLGEKTPNVSQFVTPPPATPH